MIKNYLNLFKFNGKKVFILGGLGLIGSAITQALISADAKIVVLDVSTFEYNKLKKKINSANLQFYELDCSRWSTLNKKIENVFKKFGCPDVFINCSYPKTKDWKKGNFSQNKISIMRKNVDIHLNSYAWIAYKICEKMKKKKINGSIVLLSSIYGFLGQNMCIYKNTKIRENMNYSIIKGGIINLTRQLASYYGRYNLRVNCLSPGGIEDKKNVLQDKNFIRNYSSQTPISRLGKPQEVASAALFLASDASSYVTGTNLVVDGGWSSI